jgi:hypothetical protein
VDSVPVGQPMNLNGWVFNRDEAAILEIHHLLADPRASDGVEPCKPCLILEEARKSEALVWTLMVEIGDRWMMRSLLGVYVSTIG